MIDIVEKLNRTVSLAGYGASRGFIGYFEKTGKINIADAQFAADYFLNFFGEKIENLKIVSSMHINYDELGRYGDSAQRKRDCSFADKLLSAGLVDAFDYKERFYDKFDSAKCWLAIENANNLFSVYETKNFDRSDILSMMIAQMSIDGFCGHLFLIDEDAEIAFYPHDDIGYGIVDMGEGHGREMAERFLRGIDGDGWRSVVEYKKPG